MNISEVVSRLNDTYVNSVKPALLKQDYNKAYIEMSSIYDSIEFYKKEIITDIHCGRRYVVEARLLLKNIENKCVDDKDIKNFEAYAAQTKLPKSH